MIPEKYIYEGENISPPQREIKNGTRQGTNDFREIGYGRPCPPPVQVSLIHGIMK